LLPATFLLAAARQRFAFYKQGNHWAEPSVEHAASLMHYCFDDRARVSEPGTIGREEMKEKLSLKLAGQRMADGLSLARAAQPFRAGALA
jgi:hypothetical protein